MTKEVNIVVIDSYGPAIPSAMIDKYPQVASWGGYEPSPLAIRNLHPHGSQCAEKILTALHNPEEVKVHMRFLRIFGRNAVYTGMDLGAWQWLRDVASERETYINNSWGGYIGDRAPDYSQQMTANRWRQFIEDTGARVVWAAGNTGNYLPDENRESPQSLLTDISFKVGSTNERGRTSAFSGDSQKAPPAVCMWGEHIILYNGVTDRYSRGSGTSFAAPKLTALWAKVGGTFSEFSEYIKENTVYPGDLGDLRPHPKWGYGWLEMEYQKMLADSPYLYLKRTGMLSAVDNSYWYDFTETSADGGVCPAPSQECVE